jgi:hypothetical protein
LSDNEDREAIEERNDPLEDGCTLSDGSSGACPMSQTVDEMAEKEGLAVEAVVAGVACDRLVMVACGESNAVCLLYDITDSPESPVFIKAFSTSPISENENPEQAYDSGELGDLDTETMMMVTDAESPTGKAGVIMGGAISGTLSFYEFECQSHSGGGDSSIGSGQGSGESSGSGQGSGDSSGSGESSGSGDSSGSGSGESTSSSTSGGGQVSSSNSGSSSGDEKSSGLSGGAIAGIVIACLVVVGLVVYAVVRNDLAGQKEMDTGTGRERPVQVDGLNE